MKPQRTVKMTTQALERYKRERAHKNLQRIKALVKPWPEIRGLIK